MKALKIIGIVLASLIAIFLILGLIAPKKANIQRSITIHAPKSVIYDQVRFLKKHEAWAPWNDYDPNMKQEYSGTDGEIGATAAWDGNDKAGKGSQTITALKENERVDVHVNFIKPFASEADNFMQLDDAGNGDVKATWGFVFETPFPWNAFSLFMNMDEAVGKDFEKGLNRLKTICEKEGSGTNSMEYVVKEVDFPGRTYVAYREKISFDKITSFYEQHMGTMSKALLKLKVKMAGPPAGLYYVYDEQAKTTDMAAAIPVATAVDLGKPYTSIQLPASKAISVDYYGAYEKIAGAYQSIDSYAKAKGLKTGAPAIEEYITGPTTEKDTAKWLTRITFPLEK